MPRTETPRFRRHRHISYPRFRVNHFYYGPDKRPRLCSIRLRCALHFPCFVSSIHTNGHFMFFACVDEARQSGDYFSQIVSVLYLFFSSLNISPILYSIVSALTASVLNFLNRKQFMVSKILQVVTGNSL